MRFLAILIFCLLSIPTSAQDRQSGETLVTPHYRITVWPRCDVFGDYKCTSVGHVYDVRTHRSNELYGKTVIELSCHGHIPCHTGLVLYRMIGSGCVFLLYPNGKLVVQRPHRSFSESGVWHRLSPNNSFKPKPLRGSA